MEHAPGTIFREPSGDACDHYRLYRQDLTTLKWDQLVNIEELKVDDAEPIVAELAEFIDAVVANDLRDLEPRLKRHRQGASRPPPEGRAGRVGGGLGDGHQPAQAQAGQARDGHFLGWI